MGTRPRRRWRRPRTPPGPPRRRSRPGRRTPAEERAALLKAAADRLEQLGPDLVPLVIPRPVPPRRGVADAGPRRARALPPLRARRGRRASASPCRPSRCRPPRSPRAASSAPSSTASRSAWWRASRPTTSRSPTWPARSRPALAMGNTVVDEAGAAGPAGDRACSARCCDEVGFPPGVVNVVTSVGARAGGQALSSSRDVDMVSLHRLHRRRARIGEVAARRHEAPAARARRQGRRLVFDDADLKSAIGAIASVWALPLRPDLHRADAGDRAPRRSTTSWSPGSRPRPATSRSATRSSEDTVVGPVITDVQRDRVEGYIAPGASEGGDDRRRRRAARALERGLLRRARR